MSLPETTEKRRKSKRLERNNEKNEENKTDQKKPKKHTQKKKTSSTKTSKKTNTKSIPLEKTLDDICKELESDEIQIISTTIPNIQENKKKQEKKSVKLPLRRVETDVLKFSQEFGYFFFKKKKKKKAKKKNFHQKKNKKKNSHFFFTKKRTTIKFKGINNPFPFGKTIIFDNLQRKEFIEEENNMNFDFNGKTSKKIFFPCFYYFYFLIK